MREETFEEFWAYYMGCPRCATVDAIKLAASNAWYTQQDKIDFYKKYVPTTEVLRQLEIAKKALERIALEDLDALSLANIASEARFKINSQEGGG